LRAENSERRGALFEGEEERSVGRSVIAKNLQEPEPEAETGGTRGEPDNREHGDFRLTARWLGN
jgi:hypothetical protein